MDERTKAVFRCLYIEKRSWSKVRDEYGNRLKPQQICTARDTAIRAVAEEIISVNYLEEEKDGKEEENNTSAD